MPNSANLHAMDSNEINIGALQQRVLSIDAQQRNFSDALNSMQNRFETLFAGLNAKIEERSRPQYTLLISVGVFGLAVILAVGGQALSPLRENQADLKLGMIEMTKQLGGLGEKFVSIRELDGRSARTTSELARINADIKAIDAVTVPRVEQAERTRSVDAQFVAQQRQLDDIKKAFGDTFSLRDALLQMQRRIDQLESLRRPS